MGRANAKPPQPRSANTRQQYEPQYEPQQYRGASPSPSLRPLSGTAALDAARQCEGAAAARTAI